MATEYALNLKAKLDVSDAQQKLQQLGAAGNQAFNNIEDSVKNLDRSMKGLNSSIQSMSKELRFMARAAGALMASQILGGISSRVGDRGRVGGLVKVGTDVASGAITGAVLTKSPAGAAAGMSVGGIKAIAEHIFGLFDDKTKKAALELDALAKASNDLKTRQAEVARRREEWMVNGEIERMKYAPNDLLESYAVRNQRAKDDYASLLAITGDNPTSQRLNELEEAEKEMELAEKLNAAAQKELELREKRNQRLQEEENAENSQAYSKLKAITRQEEMERFESMIGGMKPGELKSLKNELSMHKDQLRADYKLALKDSDLGKASNFEDELEAVQAKLDAIDELEIPQGSNLAGYLGDTFSSEASKGYDTSSYAKIEDAIWKQQLDCQKKIDANTSKSAEALTNINNTVTQLKTIVEENNGGANWS